MTRNVASLSLTQRAAERTVGQLESLNDVEQRIVLESFAETVSVALGASGDHAAVTVYEASRVKARQGKSVIWNSGETVDAETAALVNGTCAHALDFDDVVDYLIGHPSSVIVPALLACADETGTEGEGLLDAYVVAFQLACAVAAGLGIEEHYAHGWHATATIGVVAATAGVARLRGLDVDRTVHALAIAVSTASGLRANFGSDTKPLHVGFAARSAVEACSLAAAGVTGSPRALEAPAGFLDVLGGAPNAEASLKVLNGELRIRNGVNRKPHACCYQAQRAAEAALGLSQRWDGDLGPVQTVRLTVHPGSTTALAHPDPKNGQQARFSAPYIVACGLRGETLGPRAFTDAAATRAQPRPLMDLVEVTEALRPPVGPPEWRDGYSTLEVIRSEDAGGTLKGRVDVPPGHASRPLAAEELWQKCRDSALFGGRGVGFDKIEVALRNLATPDGPMGLRSALIASGTLR